MPDEFFWITAYAVGGLCVLGASCRVAIFASGERSGVALLGLLGPVGWIIAALIGIQQRLDALNRPAAPPD